jgi:hypothetical protein
MASVEAARLLLAKARQDEYVLEQFADNPDAAASPSPPPREERAGERRPQ